ncbi:hypothetical protein GZ77_24065 [Endozoicomonas montiporae]|uniref:Protein kinase domain-containing protein n=2 Tax=Endozoicomonas montiporae TaxID=1027273 RepID=A0A081MZH9_9GAMM|nr:lipopolysaccharide kinase InaA family protein [Endozoicomonas montiporae]AMO54716.1 lipopolysaccharide kinase [Endozoicomonas montiporae CL-33]KEQ11602.1 hypothetical protein GZ77_24065 [Endozoicomonas montiporae]
MITSSCWTVTGHYLNTAAEDAFADIDKVFNLTGERITDDRFSDVIKVNIEGTNYYVKRYTSGGKGLRRYLGRSRIRAEWENMLLFHQLGVPAAKVVAYGEQKSFTMLKRGVLITEEVRNTLDLAEVVYRDVDFLKSKQWMNSVIEQVASAAKKLHTNGFVHNDLKWRNILVTQEEHPRIALIDCPGGSKPLFPFLERSIVKDLACLDKKAKYHLSKSERMRFYKFYTSSKVITPKMKKQIRHVLSFFEGRE